MQSKRTWQTRLPSLGQDDLAADGDVTIPKSHLTHPPELHLDIHLHTHARIAAFQRLLSCSRHQQWPILDLGAPVVAGWQSSRMK